MGLAEGAERLGRRSGDVNSPVMECGVWGSGL